MHLQYIAVFSIVLKIAVVLSKSDDSKIPMLQPLMPGMQPSNADGMLQPILAGNHPGNHHHQQHPYRPISPMLDHHVYPHGDLPHPADNIEMNAAYIHSCRRSMLRLSIPIMLEIIMVILNTMVH